MPWRESCKRKEAGPTTCYVARSTVSRWRWRQLVTDLALSSSAAFPPSSVRRPASQTFHYDSHYEVPREVRYRTQSQQHRSQVTWPCWSSPGRHVKLHCKAYARAAPALLPIPVLPTLPATCRDVRHTSDSETSERQEPVLTIRRGSAFVAPDFELLRICKNMQKGFRSSHKKALSASSPSCLVLWTSSWCVKFFEREAETTRVCNSLWRQDVDRGNGYD